MVRECEIHVKFCLFFSSGIYAIFEDMLQRSKSAPAPLCGPELAKQMRVGTRVVRGGDWKWGDQDGPAPSEGKIIGELGEDGWIRVQWDSGSTNSYRFVNLLVSVFSS